MSDILTVAQSTFERFARLKALYVILAICIIDIAAMGLYEELTMDIEEQLMADAALAIVTVVGLITALVAAFEIPRELRDKTAQFILTKPMGRTAFVWGKFLGIGALALLNMAIVTIGGLAVYHANFGSINMEMAYAAILVLGEVLVLTGAGLVFSMFLTDYLAAVAVVVIFWLGHSLYMLPRMLESGIGGTVAAAVFHVFPALYHLNMKAEATSNVTVSPEYIGWGMGYAVLYALFFVGLASVLFNRKDIS
jgi:ABC-type transport system involved in multi-copper enzyme maturation permease subunit